MTVTTFLARPRVLAVATALGLAATLLPAQPAEAASRIKGPYFGMTDSDVSTFPSARPGAGVVLTLLRAHLPTIMELRWRHAGCTWRVTTRIS